MKLLLPRLWIPLLFLAWMASPATLSAQYMRIRDICRVKGSEENTLHGMGLVVGLRGTGDADGPTLRSLAHMMELMGKPVLPQTGGSGNELKSTRNVAMVYVTATVPPDGARQGDQLRCAVNAISAKSLDGGYLLLTPLVGPRPGQPRVYALAQGPLAMHQTGPTTSGVIHDGCRLEEDFNYTFIDPQGVVTLVIDSNHAGFPVADAIQQAINDPQTRDGGEGGRDSWGKIAHAVDPVNVRVKIPDFYRNSGEGQFIATLLDTQVPIQANDARVVVNERNGVIIVGEKVTVGRVAVTHKNIAIQTGNDPVDGPLFMVPLEDTSTTRLKALVDGLNALKVSPQDIIDIIKSLERSGDLYGRLIVE